MEGTQFLIISVGLLLGVLLVFGGALSVVRARRRQNDEGSQVVHPLTRAIDQVRDNAPELISQLSSGEAGATELSASIKRAAPGNKEPATNFSFDLRRKLPSDMIILTRDAGTGDWLIDLDGQRYRRLSDIHDDKAASKILSAIEGLKTFAGLPAPSPEPQAQPAPPGAPSAKLPPAARRSGQATYPAPEGSIIAQIEVILQRELSLHADVAHRHIHMGIAPDGSLLIEVDSSFYKSPDEIPDRRIHDLVKFAVHTWEKSN